MQLLEAQGCQTYSLLINTFAKIRAYKNFGKKTHKRQGSLKDQTLDTAGNTLKNACGKSLRNF
ncbi:hypothetical protein WKK05_33095 [Nostoc sp. UHCC 0302]|uniref:hypothetical protein n=1 Tax=Nostoc sp. UHCC 0302 TaxID=3134896 RepID=UPI00311CBA55